MKRKIFTTILWISLATGILFFVVFSEDKSPMNLLLYILNSFIYAFVLTFGNTAVNDFLSKKYSWTQQTSRRTVYGILATIVTNVVLIFCCNYLVFVVINGMPKADFFSEKMNLTNWFILNVAFLISAILHANGFMQELKKSTKKEVVEQKLIAKSANAQFESLKNQLDPHFLFNSLNVLSALIDENPDQAQKFTTAMSKIYRYVLEQKDKELVTIADEIEFAKTYCNLLKTRFEDSVEFTFEIQPTDLHKFVVPLSLQLLLENCIKHNLATSSKPLHIRIFTEEKFLCIENNLQPREQIKESAGIGLANIVQRYALLTKDHVYMEKSDQLFKVKIPILTQKTSQTMTTSPQSTETVAYEKAVKRVKELKGFYGNLISYCIVIPFLIIVNLMTSPHEIWFYWPMLGWGIGLLAHGMSVFAIGKNWEEKEIQKILNRENQNNYGK